MPSTPTNAPQLPGAILKIDTVTKWYFDLVARTAAVGLLVSLAWRMREPFLFLAVGLSGLVLVAWAGASIFFHLMIAAKLEGLSERTQKFQHIFAAVLQIMSISILTVGIMNILPFAINTIAKAQTHCSDVHVPAP